MFDSMLAILGPALVLLGLYLSIRHFRAARTMGYIERFNRPDMLKIRAEVESWLASSSDDSERIKQAQDNFELSTTIRAFISLFTEVGIAYRFGLVDQRIAFAYWEILAPDYWNRLEFYIKAKREKSQEIAYSFELFARDVAEFKDPIRNQLANSD